MTETKTPEAEKAVIGAVLLDPDALRFAVEHITGDDFADRRLATAFNVMIGFRGTGEPIDEQTLAPAMAERGVTGITPLDLFELRQQTPTSSNVAYYAKIVASAAGKRRVEAFAIRARQLAESTDSFTSVMEHLRGEWQRVNETPVTGDLYVPTLGEVLDGSDEYDWLIPNLLERQDRVIVTGSEGAGKSYFVQQLAILSAAGIHPTTFGPINPVRVLVVDAENSDRQWRRRVRPWTRKAAQHGSADPAQVMRIKTMPRMNITDERDLSKVHRWVDEYKPEILVIGPLYKLTPRAINSDDDAAPLITALDGLRDRGLCLVMEAHAGHGRGMDGERDLRPRGSSALMGWPEFGFGLRLDRNVEGPAKIADLVRWRGDRDDRAWPERLQRGGRWPWNDTDPAMTAWRYDQARSVANSYSPVEPDHRMRAAGDTR